MIKQFLKKFLPFPAEKSYEHTMRVLDAIEEQKMLTYMHMQQTEDLRRELAAARGETIPETDFLAKRPLSQLHFAFSIATHCNLNCKGHYLLSECSQYFFELIF